MLEVTTRKASKATIRIGLPVDYFEGPILRVLARFRREHPELSVQINAEPSEPLLRDFRRGDYDLILAASEEQPELAAHRCWLERSAWAAASPVALPAGGTIPLVVLRETSLSRRLAVAALERAGLKYEITYVGGSFAGSVQAVAAGLGVACWARRCLTDAGLHIIEGGSRLPEVCDVWAGVHLRDGQADPALETLADDIGAAVRAVTGEPPQTVLRAITG
jgi:DNA-binding transcriptional LysR family regulator